MRFSLLITLFVSSTSLFGQWTQVGSVIQNFSQNPAMTFIGDTPYVGASNVAAGGQLMIKSFDGTVWTDVGGSASSGFATHVSLEIDDSDVLYAGFVTAAGGANVKKLSGDDWVNVGPEDFTDAFNMDFKTDGNDLYVAFSDQSLFGQLTVMKFNGSSWEVLGSAGLTTGGIEYPSIEFDNGVPYVAFKDFGSGGGATVLKYNSGTNNWTTVGSGGFSSGQVLFTSLEFDNGTPHIGFSDSEEGGKVTVMKFNDISGNWDLVGNAGFSGGFSGDVSLVFYQNTPFVAFQDDANSDLSTVMTFDGTNWTKVGDSFGTGFTADQSVLINDNKLFCSFADQTSNIVLYSNDLSCGLVGLTVSGTNVNCNGDATGTATAVVSNGTDPITYSWSNGQSGQTISNLSAGTYSVTINDDNGCAKTNTVVISEPPILNGVISEQGNADCDGTGTGFATVEASGGTSGYTYAWSTGGSLATENDLAVGNHSVTITDANGCETVVSVTITGENDTTPPTAIAQNVAVALDANGTATLIAENVDNGSTDNCGISTYSLDISQFDCDDLGDVTVTLTVTDSGGNSDSETAVVTVLDVLEPTITCPANIVSNNCNIALDYPLPTATDNCDDIDITQFQGLPPGSVFPMGTSELIFAATDASGNQSNCSFTITIENDLSATADVTNEACFGETNGSATALVTGGTMPYLYQWNDPTAQNAQTATNLPPGDWEFTATDDKGCEITGSVTISELPEMVITFDEIIDETGHNMDGAISITASGGTNSGYTYSWSFNGNPFETLEDLTNLSGGEYCVIVTDSNGCEATACEMVDFIDNTSNPELEKHISLSPNPTSDWLNIYFDLNEIGEVEIDFYDALGRTVSERNSTFEKQMSFDLTGWDSGVYFIKIETEKGFVIKRIVVE